jgi:hypothetical protein
MSDILGFPFFIPAQIYTEFFWVLDGPRRREAAIMGPNTKPRKSKSATVAPALMLKSLEVSP